MDTLNQDVNTETPSSEVSATQAIVAGDVKTNQSQVSSVGEDVKKESLQDVVSKFKAELAKKDETKTSEETQSASSHDVEAKDKSGVLKENETPKAEAKTEVKDDALPFGKHPRFQQILKEKNEAVQEVEKYKGAAQRMTTVEEFCQKNSVQPQEYDNAVRMVALMKTNPREFLARAKEMVNNVEIHLGEAIPADLQKEVDEGRMAIEHAKTMSQLRLNEARNKQEQQVQVQQANQRQTHDVQSAVNGWIGTMQKTDASFKPKQDVALPDGKFELVNAKFMELWGAKPPTSVAGVVGLAQQAYDQINAFINQFQPKPAQRRSPSPSASVRHTEQTIDTSKPGWAKQVAKKRLAEL